MQAKPTHVSECATSITRMVFDDVQTDKEKMMVEHQSISKLRSDDLKFAPFLVRVSISVPTFEKFSLNVSKCS